ncbi:alpha/beta-hydrolase [Lophium mytilinum]|uniref:Alpha/beta-hydrolase n=1 Tax=Lophium mytilinum TaxID=390894 RepID=A0A6A6QZ80_9PEZI|nr:alpha/beta-hydrolase [Lophium mytilinum]
MAQMAINVAVDGAVGEDAVQPYGMHVSSRYLDLTKRKLELTRLPRELQLPEKRRWDYGTPKAVLEPLIDFWLEHYDWRTQETLFNNALPQFRTTVHLTPSKSEDVVHTSDATPTQATFSESTLPQQINSPITPTHPAPTTFPTIDSSSSSAHPPLRVHFVHKRSKHRKAIPLLFCHSWPSSFVEPYKIIDALTDPVSLPSYGTGAQQAFHVVVPSIPGFGFSDASPVEGFGLRETANAFHEVMARLGYADSGYVVCGSGWGFAICRALAIYHPQHCLAIHTTNPSLVAPAFKKSPMAWLKYHVARVTRARLSFLSFGYLRSDFTQPEATKAKPERDLGMLKERFDSSEATLASQYSQRPQTVSYSLCDSPAGLLSCVLDAVHSRSSSTPQSSQQRSPFLSPAELLGDRDIEMQVQEMPRPEIPMSPRESETNGRDYTWTPTEILSWTMMQWLPGPEAGLRWLKQATLDSAADHPSFWQYSPVPLGISHFRRRGGTDEDSPLMWATSSHRLEWLKRHRRSARWPAWETPDLLVLDLRECFGGMAERGLVRLRRDEEE